MKTSPVNGSSTSRTKRLPPVPPRRNPSNVNIVVKPKPRPPTRSECFPFGTALTVGVTSPRTPEAPITGLFERNFDHRPNLPMNSNAIERETRDFEDSEESGDSSPPYHHQHGASNKRRFQDNGLRSPALVAAIHHGSENSEQPNRRNSTGEPGAFRSPIKKVENDGKPPMYREATHHQRDSRSNTPILSRTSTPRASPTRPYTQGTQLTHGTHGGSCSEHLHEQHSRPKSRSSNGILPNGSNLSLSNNNARSVSRSPVPSSGHSRHTPTSHSCCYSPPVCHHHVRSPIPQHVPAWSCWSPHPTGPRFYGGLAGGGEYEELQDKIRMLQTEKENLVLQVTVLTEQVEAQGERIRELDSTLEDRKEQLDGTEEMLQQEMLARSSLENSKLELVGQLSDAKRKLAIVEREKLDLLEKCKKLEAELIIAKSRIVEKDAELATLKARLARNGTITPVNDHHLENEKLRNAMESLILSKEEKEKRIEELTLMVSRQKRIHDWLPSERRASEPSSPEVHGETLYSPSADSNKSEHRLTEKPPQVPRLPNQTSTPVSSPSAGGGHWSDRTDPRYSPSPSQSSLKSISKANSSENVTPTGTRTPPAKRHYSTIPRQHGIQIQQIQQQLQQHHRVDSTLSSASVVPSSGNQKSEPVTPTSKSYHNLLSTGNTSTGSNNRQSTPNKSSGVSFASEPEIVPVPSDDDSSSQILSSTLPPDSALTKMEPKDKNKGFKKIFGKLKRSGSHTMDLKEGEFKRGGIRSTAGPRLGWSVDNKVEKLDKPFSQWNTDTIIEWLNGMGLSAYAPDCKRWVKNGEHFLKATPHDLEKELGVKNPLHRKKLQLALRAMGGMKSDKNSKDKHQPELETDPQLEKMIGKLDHHWVVRWLDDVGLPQYKDGFVDARVDGRMLHCLTVEDLFALKVTNLLHHVSIKRGIQVLRENKFDPYCLKRRSLPDEKKEYNPVAVVLWTNHRVMEWLKTVDLSEYAPNLRGSGVHGALIVYEPRFNAELLAALLNIPPNKTLLRRHLTTQFKMLVGPPLMAEKRDCEILQDGVSNPPLTPNTKVKAVHKGQFTLLRKKSKGEIAFEDLVCPLCIASPKSLKSGESGIKKDENAAEEIGAVSKDISSLTNKLQDEKLLSKMETTNV